MNDLIGRRATDTITGLSGTVTGHCEYITGCNQVLIQPPIKKEGDFQEPRWMDEDRLKIIDSNKLTLPVTAPGPDKPAPIK